MFHPEGPGGARSLPLCNCSHETRLAAARAAGSGLEEFCEALAAAGADAPQSLIVDGGDGGDPTVLQVNWAQGKRQYTAKPLNAGGYFHWAFHPAVTPGDFVCNASQLSRLCGTSPGASPAFAGIDLPGLCRWGAVTHP